MFSWTLASAIMPKTLTSRRTASIVAKRLSPTSKRRSDRRQPDKKSKTRDDGLALSVAVKSHAFGVPLTRFQDLTAPLGQARKALMTCLPKNGVSRQTSYEAS